MSEPYIVTEGSVPENGQQIATPCPHCGARSLFIGSGGHLTCARVPSDRGEGCGNPSVDDAVKQLRQRAEAAESTIAGLKVILAIANKGRELEVGNVARLAKENAELRAKVEALEKATDWKAAARAALRDKEPK